ncbi:MAG: glycosyltransferase family 4 protein [Betaproteobacteria bacterium]|nr:glycosyltransferase family 4 protein [Betaproteobacteria bacterium]
MTERASSGASRLLARIREKGVLRLARRFVGMAALYGWREAVSRTRSFASTSGEPLAAPAQATGYARMRDAQFDFCRRYAAQAPLWRQRLVERLVEDASDVRGVVLCPVAGHEAGARAGRVMRAFAKAGYVGLVLPIDSAVPTVERLEERLHLAHLFPDAFANFADEPVALYVDAPRFAYVARLLRHAFVIYDAVPTPAGEGADATAERDDHAALLARADLVLCATPPPPSPAALLVADGAEDAASLAPALARLGEWSGKHRRAAVAAPATRRVDILTFNFFDWQGERMYNGGAERYVLDLALLCRRLGLEPRILQNAHHAFERECQGVPVVGLPLAAQFDLAHMSEGYSRHVADAALVIASPVELAARLAGRQRVVGINHGIHWDAGTNTLATHSPQRDRLLFDALQRVDACVCVDTNFINWVRCHDWQLAQALDYVPNYVDLGVFRPSPKDFSAARLTVLYPRRLYKARGFQDTLEACDRLLARGAPIDVHLCGGANEPEAALARAFVARHGDRARWFELPIRDMHRAYEASHIALIPTNWAEGTSLSCIEAMATRNAVIATTVGGLPNLVLDGYNGLLVKPGALALQQGIGRLVGDRALCAALAERGVEVAATLSQARWERQWTEALRRVLPALVGAPQAAGGTA